MLSRRGSIVLATCAAMHLVACVAKADGADDKTTGSQDFRANAARLEQRIHALGRFGANPAGGVSRVAFSQADIAGRDYIKSLMRDAGLDVRIDAAGNIIGRRAGTDPTLPVIMTGSHIDSVPQGGNYDGDVGVLGAIEVAQLLREHGIATRHPFEFVVFTDEEGGVVGSEAMAGGSDLKHSTSSATAVSRFVTVFAPSVAILHASPRPAVTADR